ncbi:ABC transporter permease [Candidatus Poribacteria bacterium]|nr:ABC transporter permease [Candidatus Poribacteria bacterium]
MAAEINDSTESMAAIPVNEMLRLYKQVLGPMQRALLAVAGVVVCVAALTVLATLYQAAERRRRDLAVMRALGAHPREIAIMVLLEAFLLTLLGLLAGWMIGHGLIAAASGPLRESLGFSINGWSSGLDEWQALGIVALAGLAAGVLPAITAYRRPPADDLAGP